MNKRDKVPVDSLINWLLTAALVGLIGYMLFNGGIIKKEFYVVDKCGSEIGDIVLVKGQAEFDRYMESLINDCGGENICELNLTGGIYNDRFEIGETTN